MLSPHVKQQETSWKECRIMYNNSSVDYLLGCERFCVSNSKKKGV